MCKRGTTPQQKISTKDKHCTFLGLIIISGKPVMCIVIFAGEQPSKIMEIRLNLPAETEGHPDNNDFFKNKTGPRKRFPSDLTYIFEEWTCHVSVDGSKRAHS